MYNIIKMELQYRKSISNQCKIWFIPAKKTCKLFQNTSGFCIYICVHVCQLCITKFSGLSYGILKNTVYRLWKSSKLF